MKYLSELTPAENLILTKDNVSHQELLKVTLIDLILKKVLKIFEVERQPHIKQPIRIYKYLAIGENFNNYQSKNHERIFLTAFAKDNTIEILFANLVKIGYQNSRTLNDFKNDILKYPTLKKCFKQNIFQKLYYGYSFTEFGLEFGIKINKEIDFLNAEISDLNNIENQKAIDLIKIISGNIFLLSNINYDLLNEIDNDLAYQFNKTKKDGSSCSGCGNIFNDYSSSFDSGCSSGCSSSGCSSGCGGCGGCGS